ncbi:hypothetical protein J0X14_10710 [Muricauda sp. CAU 1633]|uniref:hypothetical protein n=1 Tax=Allomuricauda sp. CAU 1633 TaxID=2816036 RepID=UPI001A8F4A6D|nr:hypothetical protein [Muricauda sp. CAU 1633]MBO0322769.1 hypothetical protein [Muricauda sp. CAU 1633]
MNSNKKWHKDYYAGKALWFGMACIGCAFYFFAPILFTSENSLIEKSGQIEQVRTFYTQVSSRGIKTVKSQLFLKLKNDNHNYKLVKNIEKSWRNEKYELIEKELKKSGRAIIWIKKSENSDLQPKVYQIATGENDMLYDLKDAKSELRWLFPFLVIIGLLMIGIYFHQKYPEQFKSLLFGK